MIFPLYFFLWTVFSLCVVQLFHCLFSTKCIFRPLFMTIVFSFDFWKYFEFLQFTRRKCNLCSISPLQKKLVSKHSFLVLVPCELVVLSLSAEGQRMTHGKWRGIRFIWCLVRCFCIIPIDKKVWHVVSGSQDWKSAILWEDATSMLRNLFLEQVVL